MKEEDANNHPNPRPVEEEVAEWSYHDFGDHRIYGLSLFSILATVHSTCAEKDCEKEKPLRKGRELLDTNNNNWVRTLKLGVFKI